MPHRVYRILKIHHWRHVETGREHQFYGTWNEKKRKKTVCFKLYRIEKLTAATTCSLTVDLSLGWFKIESWRWRDMWVEFVVGSFSCSKRFFSGTPVFPLPKKTSLPNSNSIWNARTLFNECLRTPRCSVSKQITWIYKFTIYVEPIKPKRCKGYS